MALMKDCIFYQETGSTWKVKSCTALNELYCMKECKPCGFYKSNKVYNQNGRKKEVKDNGSDN